MVDSNSIRVLGFILKILGAVVTDTATCIGILQAEFNNGCRSVRVIDLCTTSSRKDCVQMRAAELYLGCDSVKRAMCTAGQPEIRVTRLGSRTGGWIGFVPVTQSTNVTEKKRN